MIEKPVSFETLSDLEFSTQSVFQLLKIEAFWFSQYDVRFTFLSLSLHLRLLEHLTMSFVSLSKLIMVILKPALENFFI